MGIPLGIDFGMAFSLSAVLEEGSPRAIGDPQRSDRTPLMPSAVQILRTGEVQTGWQAYEQCVDFPELTIVGFEPLLRCSDPEKTQSVFYPLEVDGDHCGVHLGGRTWSDEEIFSLVFKSLVQRSGEPSKAVISISNQNEEHVEQRIRKAAERAQLDTVEFLDQTFAAALAYGVLKEIRGKNAFIHLGASHFQVALFDIQPSGTPVLISRQHSSVLSGSLVTKRISDKVCEELSIEYDDEVMQDKQLVQKVRQESEKGKCSVSHRGSYDIHILDKKKGIDFRKAISRYEVEHLNRDLIEQIESLCAQALEESGVSLEDLKGVYFVGGGSRMPVFSEISERVFSRKGNADLNVDQVVALGCAFKAHQSGTPSS